jgi:hypothetical protein
MAEKVALASIQKILTWPGTPMHGRLAMALQVAQPEKTMMGFEIRQCSGRWIPDPPRNCKWTAIPR